MFAQIKVIPSGGTKIGQLVPAGNSDDGNDVITLGLYGRNTTDPYRPGSKLSFGDYGSTYGCNVFIGELGNYDSDALELHGKNGIRFTVGAELYKGEAMRLDGNGNFWTTGSITGYQTLTYSDERLKRNIKPFTGGLAYIKKLAAISYYMQTDSSQAHLSSLNNIKPSDQKEINDLAKAKKELAYKIANPDNQIGFSAQVVQKVLPQIVKTDDKGFLSVNYTAVIPILVEAIKDQQTIIDAQQTTIDAQAKDIAAIKKKLGL